MARAVYLLIFFFHIFTAEFVPVLIIGSDSIHLPPSRNHPVQKLSEIELDSYYLSKLRGEGPIIFFEQDTLSMEDFIKFGDAYVSGGRNGSFQNLQALLDDKPSLLLPAVHTPDKLIEKLEENWDVLQLKNLNIPLRTLTEAISAKTLILIQLLPTESSTDRSLALKTNDEIIGNIVKQLEEVSKSYILVYTGHKSSWTIDQEDERERISRHILQADDEDVDHQKEIILHDPKNTTLLFTNNITFHYVAKLHANDSFNVDLGTEFSVSGSSEENSTTSIFEISASLHEDLLREINITFEFDIFQSNWILSSLNISVDSDKVKGIFAMGTNEIWAPKSYSFICKAMRDFIFESNQTDFAIHLSFNTLQLQSFLKENTLQFGYPYDCVGFFTIPILTSIFVTLLLVLILAFGLQQMTSIHTMDRFDDPKGKTISVPNTD